LRFSGNRRFLSLVSWNRRIGSQSVVKQVPKVGSFRHLGWHPRVSSCPRNDDQEHLLCFLRIGSFFRPPARLALSLSLVIIMGCHLSTPVLTVPITLAQLHEALNPIKTDIDLIKTEIISMKQYSKEQFDLIKAVLLLVPDGDADEAKQANNNEPFVVVGHAAAPYY
jgi:hypothetical protein